MTDLITCNVPPHFRPRAIRPDLSLKCVRNERLKFNTEIVLPIKTKGGKLLTVGESREIKMSS